LSLLQFKTWTIQTVEQTLYSPPHSGSQNITLKQVMTLAGPCHFTTLKEALYPLCRRQVEPQSQSGLAHRI